MASLWKRLFGRKTAEALELPEPAETAGVIPAADIQDSYEFDTEAACLSAARTILSELRHNSTNSPSGCRLDYVLTRHHMALPAEQLFTALQKLADEYGMTELFMENAYTVSATKL